MVPGLETGMDILLEDEDILPSHVGAKKTLEKQKSKESQVCMKMYRMFLKCTYFELFLSRGFGKDHLF